MLELRHIHKTFHAGTVNETTLFTDFNLTIQKGDFVSVIGSNGSGKSTLLNIICGALPIDKGEVLLENKKVNHLAEYARMAKIGRVYQDPAMGTCPSMTILENLAMAERKGKPFGLGRGVNKGRLEAYKDLLARLELTLEDKLHVPVGALSGGQRQALALLMATQTPIDFLILDEHTAALDPKTAAKIMALTADIVKEKQLTTLMVTHNLQFAVDYGNKLMMMHQGQVVFEREGIAKETLEVDDILDQFYAISIEAGNSL